MIGGGRGRWEGGGVGGGEESDETGANECMRGGEDRWREEDRCGRGVCGAGGLGRLK